MEGVQQVNPAKLLTYQGTVWEVQRCISSENGQILWGMGLNYSMCIDVNFFFFF